MRGDLNEFVRQVADATRELGIAWLGLGFRPFGLIDDVPWMPKSRYKIMRDYLPSRGRLAPLVQRFGKQPPRHQQRDGPGYMRRRHGGAGGTHRRRG